MSEVIELYQNQSEILQEAYGNAVFNLCMLKERHQYRVFSLCGSEPGVGTTTVAVDLAILLAEAGWNTLLLDGDLRKGNRYKRINDENAVSLGLTDYLCEQAALEEILHPTNHENLHYISCGNVGRTTPLQTLSSARMALLFEELSKRFDFILIDGPSVSAAVDSNFYSLRADATILVAAMCGGLKKHLDRAYRHLEKSGANLVGVIQTKLPLKEYRQYNKDYDYFPRKRFVKSMRHIKGKQKL